MNIGNIEEKILFSRLKNKDKQAFIKAYDLYIDKIYRFVLFKIGDSEEAKDLTSAIFLKTWNYIRGNNLVDYKTLKSLIYKIARNAIIDHYRKSNLLNRTLINDSASQLEIIDEKQNIMRQAEISSDFKDLEIKLMRLKDGYREIIILRFIEGLSIAEIAEILNKSKSNVRVLTHRALEALRKLMD